MKTCMTVYRVDVSSMLYVLLFILNRRDPSNLSMSYKGWLQNAKLKKIQKDMSDLGATWVSQ